MAVKLIVSEFDALAAYVSREFHYVMNDLIDNYGWKHIETRELFKSAKPLKVSLLESFGQLPEVILFWEGYGFLPERAKDILELSCHKYIFAEDLHWRDETMRYRKFISYLLCDTILSSYAYVFDQFYPDVAKKRSVVWIPHSANSDFLIPFNRQAENSILLSGAINHHYPLRQQMKQLYDRHVYSIAYHQHPGYQRQYDHQTDESVGRGYAKKINYHRAAFTDCLKFRYIVAKYFEIPATGALLLADRAVSKWFGHLGFIEDEHYMSVTSDCLEDVIGYVLDESNHKEIDQIRRNGQALVWEKHKSADRAKLIDEVCRADS